MAAKHHTQTCPSTMFPDDITLRIQFRIKPDMDRTWHNTAQCQCPTPNSAFDGFGRIWESIRV